MARTTEVRYCPNGAIAWKVEEAMDTSLFDWDEANVGHIAEHDISPEEAEEVILNDPMDIGFEETEDGEERWSYVGETNQGSIYQVVMTLRGEKIRVVTAFEPTRQDRLVYMEMKAQQQ